MLPVRCETLFRPVGKMANLQAKESLRSRWTQQSSAPPADERGCPTLIETRSIIYSSTTALPWSATRNDFQLTSRNNAQRPLVRRPFSGMLDKTGVLDASRVRKTPEAAPALRAAKSLILQVTEAKKGGRKVPSETGPNAGTVSYRKLRKTQIRIFFRTFIVASAWRT